MSDWNISSFRNLNNDEKGIATVTSPNVDAYSAIEFSQKHRPDKKGIASLNGVFSTRVKENDREIQARQI